MNKPLLYSALNHGLQPHGARRWFILAGITALLIGCQGESVDSIPRSALRQVKPQPVLIQVAEITPVTVQYQRPGHLQFKQLARLFSQEEGIIQHIAGFAGDMVANGQLLIQLDDAQLRAEYERALAVHQQTVLDHARLIKLAHRGAASEES